MSGTVSLTHGAGRLAAPPVAQSATISPQPTHLPALIGVERASVDAGGRRILDSVTLDIHPREIVTIIGPNGAGKTTLARLLLGVIPPAAGRVYRLPGLTLGYVPQRFRIEPTIPLTVERFMTLGVRAPRQTVTDRLEETGAAHLAGAQLTHLSGGEFQRVLLARALVGDPQLLVLDEPVQAVDYTGAAQLYDLIDSIRRRRGCGVLLISHDLHVVLGASDRVICLNRHICCEGVPTAVAQHPEYVRLFGQAASESFGLYRHRHDHTHDLSGDVREACDHVR
jgi:zinc transport system ATP-binding protein